MRHTGQDFVRLALARGALRFGEFKLKSGRTSPYFLNLGALCTGAALDALGALYARAIRDAGLEFDALFGPAYKGVPLAAAAAVALHREYGLDAGVAFDRKEAKDHGEGGRFVGAPLAGRVLIVDDVITAGTAVKHALRLFAAAGARAAGVVVCFDRCEKDDRGVSAIAAIEREHGLPCVRVADYDDLLAALEQDPARKAHLPALAAYRREFGV